MFGDWDEDVGFLTQSFFALIRVEQAAGIKNLL